MSELQVALRREFARAARHRQELSLLVADVSATSDVLGKVRDAVRVFDSAVAAADDRVAVILPETPLAGALLVATRLAGALGPSAATGGAPSLGVATYPSADVADPDALLRAAERAMKSARSRGGGILTPQAR